MKKEMGGARKQGKFVSIKVKLISVYIGLLILVFVLITLLLPDVFQRYFIQERRTNLENTHDIVASVLESEDVGKSDSAPKVLEAAAEASHTSIWVCIPVSETRCRIITFGGTENINKDLDFNDLTTDEKQTVLSVIEGNTIQDLRNGFPTAFHGATISLGYPQDYLQTIDMTMGGTTSTVQITRSGAIFLHIAMDDIDMMSGMMQKIMFWVMFIMAALSICMTTLMGNNILTPVNKMKDAAEKVAKGDYSQEVPILSNDEIGQLAESFNAMESELAGVDTLQRDFLANISHDFRSPLTSIKGYVEAMMDGTIPPEDHQKYLQIVLDESNRLIKMTNNVLDLTKMENGQIELHMTVFDVNEMIVKLALSLEKRVEEKQIQMHFQFLQEKLYVRADMDLIERVVYNLLDNALKFTRQGDSITVETSIVGGKAMVSVIDTGVGMSPEALPHIFERFNKGDKSRGTNKMGAGLGLAIVKQIMLQHQQDITVQSKPGQGTRFDFTLELAGKNEVADKP